MTRASDLAKLLGAGATINDGTTITTADNTNTLSLISTDADASTGPNLVLQRDSASPADNDLSGTIKFIADNDAAEATDCVSIFSKIIDASNGSEDASLLVNSIVGGSQISRFNITPTEIAINDDSIDLDFRVESNGNANMLFVEGGTDRVGIGTNSPARTVQIVDSSATPYLSIVGPTGSGAGIMLGDTDDETVGRITYDNSDNGMQFWTNDAQRMKIDSSGNMYVNNDGSSPLNGRFTVYNDTAQDAIKTYQATSGTTCLWNRIDHTASYFAVFRKSTTTVGTITTNGSATTYGTSSDYRLKENLEYSFDATTRLKQLKPCRFNWIADETNTLVDGFIAHEVSSVVPEAIHGKKDAVKEEVLYVDGDEIPDGKKIGDVKEASEIIPQTIDQSKLVPLLVKTIQELEARITALESA